MRHLDSSTPSFSARKALYLGTAAVLTLLALNVHADPIQDGALAPYRAGWFPNASPQGPLTCAQTCKAKAPGTIPEHEASAVPPTRRAFVCRVTGRPNGNLATSLYGSQFDDRPACYTTGLDLKGSFNQRYFCLCVAP
jgi:hypothetical protein